MKYFLGIEVTRSQEGICISQRKYTLDLLKDSGMLEAKPTDFSMEQYPKVSCEGKQPLWDPLSYRQLVGKLIYLTITRFEITFVVNQLSQFMHEPYKEHFDAVIRVLKYSKKAPS